MCSFCTVSVGHYRLSGPLNTNLRSNFKKFKMADKIWRTQKNVLRDFGQNDDIRVPVVVERKFIIRFPKFKMADQKIVYVPILTNIFIRVKKPRNHPSKKHFYCTYMQVQNTFSLQYRRHTSVLPNWH